MVQTELLNECSDYGFLVFGCQFIALMLMSLTRLKPPIPNKNLVLETSSGGHWVTFHITYSVISIYCKF